MTDPLASDPATASTDSRAAGGLTASGIAFMSLVLVAPGGALFAVTPPKSSGVPVDPRR